MVLRDEFSVSRSIVCGRQVVCALASSVVGAGAVRIVQLISSTWSVFVGASCVCMCVLASRYPSGGLANDKAALVDAYPQQTGAGTGNEFVSHLMNFCPDCCS